MAIASEKRTFKSVVKTVISMLNARRLLRKKRIKRRTLTVLALGSAFTGKTAIIHALCDEEFTDDYTPTVLDINEKETLIGNSLVKFEFIDISGHYKFPAMLKLYIAKADIFFLVYNTNEQRNSYTEILRLKSEIENVKEKRIADLSVAVIRSKCDLKRNSKHRDEIDEEIALWCGTCFHCSAKTNYNISEINDYLLSEGLFADSPTTPIERNCGRRLSGRYIYGGKARSKSLSLNRRNSFFP